MKSQAAFDCDRQQANTREAMVVTVPRVGLVPRLWCSFRAKSLRRSRGAAP